MSITIQRRTLYALLSEFELDLREVIRTELLPPLQLLLLTDDERTRAYDRFVKDRETASDSASLDDLLNYLDLGDLTSLIQRHSSTFSHSVRIVMKKTCQSATKLIPIRNRVMHSRPLEFDDFTRVFEFCKETTRTFPDRWRHLRNLLREIRADPYYVSKYPIPIFEDASPTFHNLPSPDFDDTGFIGRQPQLAELINALKGPYPVITVIGEGGVGKTALALKACYTLLDETPTHYEALIWVTAKANRLTPSDIEDIDGAINTSTGLIEAASNALVRQDPDPERDLYLNLTYHRILLIIDNLETVLDDKIRTFVRNIPHSSSKILITTRVGLGAYNFPIELRPLDRRDSRLFFRRTATVWQVNEFTTLPEPRVDEYCERLQHNPLFIKWFMQTIRTGKRPETILANPKILLQYCLQNVFGFLSDDSKVVAWALLTIGGSRPQSTISYVTGLSSDPLEVALTALLSANVVSMRPAPTVERDATYALSPLSQYYLANYMAPPEHLQKDFIQRNNVLRSAKDEFGAPMRASVYSVKNVFLRDDEDIPAAMALRRSIEAVLGGDVDTAINECEDAARMSPTYFEVKRVEALIAVQQKNFVNAEACYSAAISLAPKHAPLRLWYGGFLLRFMQDHEKALAQYDMATELDPGAPFLYLELARARLFARLFEEAEDALKRIDNSDKLTSRQQRQLVDLRLQIPARRADLLIQMEKYREALEKFEMLKTLYETCDPAQIDDKAIANICRSKKYLARLRYRLRTSEEKARWEAVSAWLESLCGVAELEGSERDRATAVEASESVEGRIVNLRGSFGFIDSVKGQFFFHTNSFAGQLKIEDMSIGDHVIFDLGYNHQGACAINIRLSP
jgi:tetratricopeptide (TPR) repeat protein